MKSKDLVLKEIELEELLKACEKPKQKLVAYTLAYTGMRASEYVHLRPSWIDWQNMIIKIPSEVKCTEHPECRKERYKTKKDGTRYLSKKANTWKPKTKNSVRAIPIDFEPRLRGALREYEDILKEPRDRVAVYRMIKRLASKTSIKTPVTPHVLRATFASICSAKGMSAGNLQALMGWERLDTAQHYVKASGVNVANELNEIWSKRR